MENEELENTYIEVPTESDYDDYDDDFALGDYAFIGFIAILGCAVFAFVMKTIAKEGDEEFLKAAEKDKIPGEK